MTDGTAKCESADLATLGIGISVYRPDIPLLEKLITILADVPARLYLHVDGPSGEAILAQDLERMQTNPRLRLKQSPVNQGIAAALNHLAEAAECDECSFLLYFDQDSEPQPDLPARLMTAFRQLEAGNERPAVVGPLPFPHDPAVSKAPRYQRRTSRMLQSDAVPVDYLITSGSLVKLSALRAVGPFEESYRIDAVDIEWCFRAWSQGWSVWLLETAAMRHRIGTGVVSFGPIAFPRQNASRMATYVRNQFRMTRLNHVPLLWKFRTAAYVPLQALVFAARMPNERLRTGRTLLRAAWQGLRRS